MKRILIFIMVLLSIGLVSAAAPSVDLGACYNFSTISVDDGSVDDLVITEVCNGSGSIEWTADLNLTALGEINTGVVIDENTIQVNSLLRPDLDARAHLTFNTHAFAMQPDILEDGESCVTCDNATWDRNSGVYEVDVTGFSTYTLTSQQDMTVYTDDEAYLEDMVYQTIDFGAANLTYKCVVMIFDDATGKMIQSNPRRQTTSKTSVLSVSTNMDDNSPEYLGYFQSENGLANVYYQKDLLIGYNSYIYVAKCHTATGLEKVYEERITPQYWEMFKSAPSKWIWWTNSASVATWMIIFIIIAGLIIWYGIRNNFR